MNYREHKFSLPKEQRVTIGRQSYVIEYAAGKKVLHLGCVDEGLTQEKFQQGLLLHDRIQSVARELWGIDNDGVGLDWMREHGYQNLFLADIEKIASLPEILDEEFDLILLPEVMEHLDNPGRFLQCVLPLLREHTELLITVPNATSLANLIEYWYGRELVHPDHNFWFSYRTLTSLLGKFGLEVVMSAAYSQYNYHHSILGSLRQRFIRIIAPGRLAANPQNGASSPNSKEETHPMHILGWLKMAATTLLYRFFIHRNPFFADGLIFIVKAKHDGQSNA